jgi:uncharacterized oxidoreductase
MKLDGNTILLTGGSSGIGLALAKALVQRGNTVIVTGRDQAKLDRAKKEVPQLVAIKSDVSVLADIDRLHGQLMQEHPKLNVLINNAGIMSTINVHKSLSAEEFTREVDVNLKGPLWMVHKFLPHLKKQDAAAILNVSSGLAFVPLPTSPVYCATKAGLHSFTQSLRVQLKNTKVQVFELAPPATQTELLTGTSDAEDLKGVTVMPTETLVEATLKGLSRDELEIRPGQSNQLRFMNRLAPDFILSQLSRPVDRMLAKSAE